jgi:predicted DNA-binding transcriptional regulator YafY
VNRLERLLNLVAALLDANRPLGRDDLRFRVPGYPDGEEAFRRAFERDKEALRSMGIPVSVEPLNQATPETGMGYRIPREQYYLRDPGLAADELAALHLAAATVRLEGTAGDEAMWKLGGALDQPAPGGAVAALPGSEHLAGVFEAVTARSPLTFGYRGATRTIDPWRIAFRNGHWYVNGFDHERGEERSFRLDRFDRAPEMGAPGSFERAHGRSGPRPPWEMGDEEEVMAEVLVDAAQAGQMIAEVGEDAVRERGDDGTVVVGVRVTNRDAFRTLVLGFLDHAEVLGPDELRNDMVGWLLAMASSGTVT